MKKRQKILLIFIIIILIVILIFFSFRFTGKVVFTPAIPSDCSANNIRSTWDSIFNETSTGITIFSNTSQSNKCNFFIAYKVIADKMYILHGEDNEDYTYITAVEGNFTQQYISIIRNITDVFNETHIGEDPVTLIPPDYIKLRTINITQADKDFKRYYKITPGTWEEYEGDGLTVFEFYDNETTAFLNKEMFGDVMANYTENFFVYQMTNLTSCIPSWTAVNTSCRANDYIIEYFVDENDCNAAPPANLTFPCDYDGNGIAGNLTLINSRTSLAMYVNQTPVNLSQSYSGLVQKVEFKSGGNAIVSFDWNFSNFLSLDDINISRESTADTKGHIVIKGIGANKKVLVDKLVTNSERICVKNREVNLISDMSANCTNSNEFILDCPDSNSGVSCIINGSFYQLNGLTSSAVRELGPAASIGITPCVQSWNCTGWSACSGNLQARVCIDTHNCGNITGRPIQNQSCGCNPNWVCTGWVPNECPRNNTQTRTCNDANSCNNNSGMPALNRACTYTGSGEAYEWMYLIVVSILGLAIIIIVIMIIYALKDKNSFGSVQNYNTKYYQPI